MKNFLLSLIVFCSGSVFGQIGQVDNGFNSGSGTDNAIHASLTLVNGQILIAGEFTHYNGIGRKGIALLDADGSLNTGFDPGEGFDAGVNVLALQPDGKIIAGGAFTTYDGTIRNRIVRIHPDGSIDNTFDPGDGLDAVVRTLVQQPDGKVIVGGDFTSFDGTSRNGIIRLNANGSLDESFIPITLPGTSIYSLLLLGDGKIVVGGDLGSGGDITSAHITRLNGDGTLDLVFDPGSGANYTIYAMAQQSDGKIIIVGHFAEFNGVYRSRIARLLTNGNLDPTFDPGDGPDQHVQCLALQADGKILLGGGFTNYDNEPVNKIIRLIPNGTLDTSFAPVTGPNGPVSTISVQADGKIIAGGNFTQFDGAAHGNVIRLRVLKSVDPEFNSGTGANGAVLASKTVGSNGSQMIIAGAFTQYNGVAVNRIARINRNGSLDATFLSGLGANDEISTIDTLPSGDLLIGGKFTTFDGHPAGGLAKLSCDGEVDTTFTSSLVQVDDITVINQDSVIIVGTVDMNLYVPSVLVMDISTSVPVVPLPPSPILFGESFTITGTVHFDQGSTILAGGEIPVVGGLPAGNLIVVTGCPPPTPPEECHPSETVAIWPAPSIGEGAQGHLAYQGGTHKTRIEMLFGSDFFNNRGLRSSTIEESVLVVGNFATFNGMERRGIAKVTKGGALDTSFDPGMGANAPIQTVAPLPDGKIMIGGDFTSFDGVPRNRIARLHADGSIDLSFDPGSGTDTTVHTLSYFGTRNADPLICTNYTPASGEAVDIFAGGEFTQVDLTPQGGVVVFGASEDVDCLGVSGGSALPGSTCNDGNPNTGNDVYGVDCVCAGVVLDCLGVLGGSALPGTPCDDGEVTTENDLFGSDCVCAGTQVLVCPPTSIVYVHASATGGNDGSSWADAFTTLQDALSLTCNNVNQVWVASGTYYPDQGGGKTAGDRTASFVMKNNLAIYGGFAGTESNLSERNMADNPTLLSGDIGTPENNIDNSYNVVTSIETDATSRLDGFVITGGRADGSVFEFTRGGGVHFGNNSVAVLANCVIQGNHAQFGGGIYTRDQTNPTIINCLISGNTASAGGGGVCNSTYGSSTIINSTIAGNTKEGIMNFAAGSSSILTNCIVWGNQTAIGGAGTSTVSNSIVEGGYAGTGNFNVDPLFTNLLNPGLNTGGDYSLNESSPAINKGNNEAYTSSGGDLHADFDVAGNPRLYDGIPAYDVIDIGAFELQSEAQISIIYVKVDGIGNGSSWSNAMGDLQEAIDAGVDQVWVAKGEYQPQLNSSFVMSNNVAVYGGFDNTGNPAFSERNWNVYTTTLWGNGNSVIHNQFSESDPLTSSGVLDGFIISNGASSEGGGIYNKYASPTLSNLKITLNQGWDYGGGIYNEYSSPQLTNVMISDNNGINLGGGMYNSYSSPILINVNISGNGSSQASQYGGGIYNTFSSPILKNSKISGNGAVQGGGIANYNSSSPVITNSLLANNISFSGSIIINDSGNGSFINCTLIETYNDLISSTSSGGDLTFKNCIIWGELNGAGYTATFSLIKGNSNATDGNIVATDLLATNIFTDFNNGDYSLNGSSPAINTGNNEGYSSNGGSLQDDLDLAGNPRLFGDVIDMGAFEVQTLPDCNGVLNGSASIDDCGVCSGGDTGEVPNQSCTDCNDVVNGTASMDNCGTCVGGDTGLEPCLEDCNGVFGGTATIDDCGVCDSDPTNDNTTCLDCAGVVNGTASIDECGICSGGNTELVPNQSCTDCNGVVNGTASLDNCETCVGGTTGLEPCLEDCNGEFGGTATMDDCDVCDSDPSNDNTTCLDCAGVVNGDSYEDDCGVCDNDPSNDNASCTDCAGVLFGTAYLDNCETCVGGNTGFEACIEDCNGDLGGTATMDDCGVCDNDSSNDNATCTDCAGVLFGTAYLDNCESCVGGNTGVDACIEDCNGDFGGTATIDDCGVCDSDPSNDNTTCMDCAGVVNGMASIDDCGVCSGGDTGEVPNQSCTDCNDVVNGTAYLDNCETCVGGNTGVDACIEDCNGDFGGTATIDDCGVCDSDPTNDNTTCLDCAGVVNGDSYEDDCGVCDNDPSNDNASCTDCAGVLFGTAYLDNCETCVGGNTGLEACVEDCNGDLGGIAFLDNCSTCVGGNTGVDACVADCNGDFGGIAFLDNCSTCVGGTTGIEACVADCNGDFGGIAFLDNCSTCVGGNTGIEACVTDCNGDFGGIAFLDNCSTCVGGNTGLEACVADCNGDFGGIAFLDNCSTCVGGNTGLEACVADCNGDFGGIAFLDNCETCVGGNTGIEACVADCNGDFGGIAFLDNCETCVGGNTGIEACVADCNGDFGGIAFLDNCSTCVGGNTGLEACVADCNGDLGGTATLDDCDVCDSDPTNDNTTCLDCAGVVNGDSYEDACGLCDNDPSNDNASCTDCAGVVNGDALPGAICSIGSDTGIYNVDCECEVTISYDCPELEANIGDSCDDGDEATANDVISSGCECHGAPVVPSECSGFVYYLADNTVGEGSRIYEITLSGGTASLSFIAQYTDEIHIAYNAHNNLIYGVSKTNNSYVTLNPHEPSPVFSAPVSLSGNYGQITGAVFAPDGSLLMSSQSTKQIYSINVTDNEVSVYDTYAPILGGDIAFDSDGVLYLATNSGGGLYKVYPAGDMSDELITGLTRKNTGLAITDTDKLLLTVSSSSELMVLNTDGTSAAPYALELDGATFTLNYGDMASGCSSYTVPDPGSCENFSTFYAQLNAAGNATDIYGVSFSETVANLNHITTVPFEAHIGYDGASDLLYLASKTGSFYWVYSPGLDEVMANISFSENLNNITAVEFNPSDGQLYVGHAGTKKIFSVNPASGAVTLHGSAPVYGGDLAISADGAIYLATQSGNALYDVTNGSSLEYIGGIPSKVTGSARSNTSDGLMLSNYNTYSFTEINVSNASAITSYEALLGGEPFRLLYGDMAAGCANGFDVATMTAGSNNVQFTDPIGVDVQSVNENTDGSYFDSDGIAETSGSTLTSIPNPTSGVSQVVFVPAETGYTLVEVYDMNGRKVETLFSQEVNQGEKYGVDFNGDFLPNGVYVYRLTTQSETIIEKFMVVR